jgi:hypothetical protein
MKLSLIAENHCEVLAQAAGKTKRDATGGVASWCRLR